MPALLVGHTAGGDWSVGDGVNDPNLPGAAVATHMHHVIERNSSIRALAGLPPGHEARRQSTTHLWVIQEAALEP
jgi:hypothetical protein